MTVALHFYRAWEGKLPTTSDTRVMNCNMSC